MSTLAQNPSDEISSHEMEAKFSYSVLKSSLPFSVTAIIYVIIFIPIAVKQFLAAFNGPIQNKPALQFFLTLWFLCAGNFTTLMNLIFYGVLSKVLRQEVAVRVKYRFSRVSLRVQQIRRLVICIWPTGKTFNFNFRKLSVCQVLAKQKRRTSSPFSSVSPLRWVFKRRKYKILK